MCETLGTGGVRKESHRKAAHRQSYNGTPGRRIPPASSFGHMKSYSPPLRLELSKLAGFDGALASLFPTILVPLRVAVRVVLFFGFLGVFKRAMTSHFVWQSEPNPYSPLSNWFDNLRGSLRLFGKGYSSDVTGDGPGIDEALAQLPQPGRKPNQPRRNKKVDHQKPKSGGRQTEDGMEEKEAGPPRQNKHPAQLRVEKRAEQEKAKSKKLIVVPKMNGLYARIGWDGVQGYNFSEGKAVGMDDGMVLELVMEGALVQNVEFAKAGYLQVKEGAEGSARAVGILEQVTIDVEFTLEGQIYTPTTYVIFKPFLLFLQQKVSTPVLTDTHRNTALASANRHYGNLGHHEIISQTYLYYRHYCRFRVWRMITGFGRLVVEDRDRLTDCEMLLYGEVKLDGDVGRHASIDCPVANNYVFRPDCLLNFKNHRGRDIVYYAGLEDPENPDSYPSFMTTEPGANGSRYSRSIYTGFYPNAVRPFVMYSVNAANACKALKRMCGIRESLAYDSELTSLQYCVFSHLFHSKELEWIGSTEVPRLGRSWSWRSRFLQVARLKYNEGEDENKIYDSIIVGDESRVAQLRAKVPVPAQRRMVRTVEYPNPLSVIPGWFSSPGIASQKGIASWFTTYAMDEGQVFGWFRKHSDYGKIVSQMLVGFSDLLKDFNRSTLDAYSDTHPKWIYRDNYLNFTTFLGYQESREELALIPHIKRALRHMFVERQVEHTPDNNMTRFVEAKVKKEFAKQGKVPRLYVTYDAGCMYANELPEYAKVCLDGIRTYTHNGVTVHINIFAKPTTPGLTQSLRDVIASMSTRDEVYILIYSDDSVWAGNLNAVPFAFNVDISSCDSGNKGGVFGLIYMLLSQFSPELAVGLVSQCSNPIKLVNPEDPDETCDIHMHSLFEGSGTVLTTILNHVAMFMVAQAAVIILGDHKSKIGHWDEIGQLVVKCGEAFGHVLSVEPARDDLGFAPELIQFLKRSPLRLVTGEYVPVMNYGTIFRSFGSLEGDLTADMVGMSVVEFAQLSRDKRADLFLSGVVAGLKNEPTSIVLSALRQRFCLLPGSLVSGWDDLACVKFSLQSSSVFSEDSGTIAEGMVSTESLCRRYNLHSSQLAAFAGKIANCRIGHLYPDDCVSSFARVDYGCADV